jgi:hypothetical protein
MAHASGESSLGNDLNRSHLTCQLSSIISELAPNHKRDGATCFPVLCSENLADLTRAHKLTHDVYVINL